MTNTNLIVDPSFEGASITAWTTNNCSLEQDSFPNVNAGTGTYSAKLTATNNSIMSIQIDVSGLTPGQNHTLAFYVKSSPVGDSFPISVSIAGQTQIIGPSLAPSSIFERKVFGFQATSSSDTLVIGSGSSNTVGDVMWLDNIMLNAGRQLPYFDGSYPYSSWSGTANASTSTNSVLDSYSCSTTEAIIVNGICYTTYSRTPQNKNGRYSLPIIRGDDIVTPGVNGKIFVPNKPIDSGLWTLNMLVLGCNDDGSMPADQRTAFENNLNSILGSCISDSGTVNLYAWQPDGSVRTTPATVLSTSAIDGTMTMGGRRGEFAIAFDILKGYWSEYLSHTITGTAGSGWSNQYLTLDALKGGNVPIEDAVITVTGPITNPKVQNDTTGTYVQYTGTVSSGQSWVIDCGNWTSEIASSSVVSNTSHYGHPRFVLIDPGNSSTSPNLFLTGTATGAGTNLSVTATRKFWIA